MANRAQAPDVKAVEQAEAAAEYREAQADKNFTLEVLRRSIEWKLYQNEGKLSAKEVNLILGYDQQPAEAQKDYLDECGPALAGLFLKVLSSISALDTLEYTVVLIDQLFSGAEKSDEQIAIAAEYFLTFKRENPQVDLAAPFLQILSSSGQHNPFTLLRVQHILAVLLAASYSNRRADKLSAADEAQQRQTVSTFLRYLISKISQLSGSSAVPSLAAGSSDAVSPSSSSAASSRELLACLSSLKDLLRASPRIQELFAELDGLRALTGLLTKETQNAQLLYLVGFNIWLLSYEKTLALKLNDLGVIGKLVAVVKVNVMEKVIRISFATLRNLLDHNVDVFNEEMIGHGLPSVVDTLSRRKFKDADVANDMARIGEVLAETMRNMSTFDKYAVEVQSGALNWTNPAHKSEIFWRENINQFENGAGPRFALVQSLIKWAAPHPAGAIAAGSVAGAPGSAEREEIIREVACFDLGEFARFHPEGKKVLAQLKAKEVLMKNLQDKSPRVSKAALLATQKLMVANWEMLNKNSSGGVAALVSQKK